MANCFENVPHEALDFCPNDEISSGVSRRIFYTPTEFIDKMTLPAQTGDYASRVTIAEGDLLFKEGKTVKGIDVLVDENELKDLFVGSKGNLKPKSELEIYVPGLRAEVIGFKKTYRNVPMVFFIKDANGVIWVLGTTINPAYMESGDGTTGKKYEDNSGTAFKISANCGLLKYAGPLTEAE